MQDQPDQYASTSRSTYERTYWRRTDKPSAWWPWGLLPLLGLLLLFLYGALRTAPAIQADMQDRVSMQLAANHINVSSVAGDGQIVNIHAIAEDASGPGIRGVAGITKCDTWAGALQCPTDVKLTLEQAAVALPDPRHHDFEFSVEEGTLHLRGEVPSDAIKNGLVSTAKSQFANVMDHLVVSSEAANAGYSHAGDKALSVLKLFERGTARWQQGVFNATGWITGDNATSSRQAFNARQEGVNLGELVLNELQSASNCNAQFASLLARTSIRFRTSSAVIDASSQALLNELADTAKVCPGMLSIEGHTDNVGAEESNQRLSFARAQAVSSALTALSVSANRLTAVGHGESEPIAPNSTAAGRAQNRRIAIRILESATE